LQGISISHCNRPGKIDEDIFALIRHEPNAATMACVKIESKRANGHFFRPMPGRAMN
jgi:hypothetical protein